MANDQEVTVQGCGETQNDVRLCHQVTAQQDLEGGRCDLLRLPFLPLILGQGTGSTQHQDDQGRQRSR